LTSAHQPDLDYPYENGVRDSGRFARFKPGGRKIIHLVLLGCWCLALPLGLTTAAASTSPLPVAASIIPLGDFCRQIGGDLVRVQVLIPPGASPHVFEPAPSAMARAAQARVIVYIGAGLEPWFTKLLQARGSKDLVVVEASHGIPLLGLDESHHHLEEARKGPHAGETHSQGGVQATHLRGNPHIWLDPVLAQGICRKIAAAFIQADPVHRTQYEANLQKYLAALAELNREIENHARNWRLRDYVAFHPAFAYFARRYGLHEVGTIEAAPGREPTPRHLQNLVAAVHRYGIKVVFAEPQFNPRVAEVIAQEAAVKMLMLDPMGGRPPYGDDYLKLMRYNLATLDHALK
jgi:zinc transport system substrate-binding protein